MMKKKTDIMWPNMTYEEPEIDSGLCCEAPGATCKPIDWAEEDYQRHIGEEAINNYHDDMAATLLDSVSEHHNYLLDEIARRWNASGDSHNLEYEACYFITARATREYARAAMNALPKDIREMMGYK